MNAATYTEDQKKQYTIQADAFTNARHDLPQEMPVSHACDVYPFLPASKYRNKWKEKLFIQRPLPFHHFKITTNALVNMAEV